MIPDTTAVPVPQNAPTRTGVWAGLAALVLATRPRQWTKNVLVFAGLLFTLDQKHPVEDFARAGFAFGLFCLLSGAVYLVNDLVDVEADRQHPKKRLRPLASGRLGERTARVAAALLFAAALAGAWTLNIAFFTGALIYGLISLLYTLRLKHVVLIDVMALASGFVLRAAAGCFAVGVPNSPWLLLCTTLLALFLGLAKRRGEVATLGDNPATRRILADYSLPLLDQLITIVASACIMAYALYTFFARPGQGFVAPAPSGVPPDPPFLMMTIPFVIYGVFRYLYLVHRKNEGESPESVLLTDRPTLVNVLLFVVCAAAVVLATHGSGAR